MLTYGPRMSYAASSAQPLVYGERLSAKQLVLPGMFDRRTYVVNICFLSRSSF